LGATRLPADENPSITRGARPQLERGWTALDYGIDVSSFMPGPYILDGSLQAKFLLAQTLNKRVAQVLEGLRGDPTIWRKKLSEASSIDRAFLTAVLSVLPR
jgi:hypothetical protein